MSQLEQDAPFRLHLFGNLTAAATAEVLVCNRGYVEPAAQAQRSLVSTSNQDKPGGSGAAAVRVDFLNSNYELKSEDVTLNGTSAVDMIATDLRFVQDMKVIQGTYAVGAVKLMTQTGGGGTEITGIGSGTTEAFLCHHYVPAGKRAWIQGWGAVIDDECSFKLNGRTWYGANLVDDVRDLYKMFLSNPTPPRTMEFNRVLPDLPLGEKTYVRVTVTPNQTTSTVIRAYIDLWEE